MESLPQDYNEIKSVMDKNDFAHSKDIIDSGFDIRKYGTALICDLADVHIHELDKIVKFCVNQGVDLRNVSVLLRHHGYTPLTYMMNWVGCAVRADIILEYMN
jgi:hypothetical protein